MPRQRTKVEYNNFTGGIVTEVNEVNAPENTSADEQNMDFLPDGSRRRRTGLDWVAGTAETITNARAIDNSFNVWDVYEWRNVGDDASRNYLVIRYEQTLRFYDLDHAYPGSAASFIQSLTIALGRISSTRHCDFTTAYGKLIITTGSQWYSVVYWDGNTSSLVLDDGLRLKVRDIWGIDDGIAVDDHTGNMFQQRQYNLRNQGWPTTMRCAGNQWGSINTTNADPIIYTNLQLGPFYYPSHADIPWSCNMTASNGGFTDNIGAFSPWEIEKSYFGTTPAPKGKYIIDLFDRDPDRLASSTLTGVVPAIPTDKTVGYVDRVSSFAGRIWYSIREFYVNGGDANTPYLGNLLMYSRSTSKYEEFNQCYTENDLTSQDYNDVLDTDGGFIRIAASGQIIGMHTLGESLIVLASNGVWEVFGGDAGFSATEQTVNKIYDEGCIGQKTIVKSETGIGFWSENGIHVISIDPQTGRAVGQSVSQGKIDDLYMAIPRDTRANAEGTFDKRTKQFLWLYNDGDQNHEYHYDHELIFDLKFGSFTKRAWTPKSSVYGPFPVAHIRLRNLFQSASYDHETSLMYLLLSEESLNVTSAHTGGFVNENWKDFVNSSIGIAGGTESAAYIWTNPITGGNSGAEKQLPYIHTNMKRTETGWSEVSEEIIFTNPSSCKMRVAWDWTNVTNSNKWSQPQEIYRFPRAQAFGPGSLLAHDVIHARSKIRGSGNAFSLRFDYEPSSTGYNMHLLGWGCEVAVEQ